MACQGLVASSLAGLMLISTLASGQLATEPPAQSLDTTEMARQLAERPGIVLSTPRVDVANADLELAHHIADIVEQTVARLPPVLTEPGIRIRVDVEGMAQGFCPARAFASTLAGYGFITLYFDSTWSVATLTRIVEHEVGHVFHRAGSGQVEGPRGDAILSEGLATWIARDAWLEDLGFASFGAAVESYIREGRYWGLADRYGWDPFAQFSSASDCFALRDQLYTQWGGFVDYLVSEHGLDAVLQATDQVRLVTDKPDGSMALSPLDYETAFGTTLAELEERWLESISARHP